MAKIYNIFISHSWSYSDAYKKLIGLLESKPYFSFKDYSVPKDDPVHDADSTLALYAAIKRQMAPTHIVLIMAGKYATYSKWIDREIKIAKTEYGDSKPIVGIRPWASTQVSQTVREESDVLVAWNTDSIVNAIRDYSI